MKMLLAAMVFFSALALCGPARGDASTRPTTMPSTVSIQGEVRQPGVFQLTNRLTVDELLKMGNAGKIDLQLVVYLVRGKSTVVSEPYWELAEDGSKDIALVGGDIVVVLKPKATTQP